MDIRNSFNSSLRAKILIRVLVVLVHMANRAGKAGGYIAPHTSSPSHNDNTQHNNPISSLDPLSSPRLHPEFSHSDWLLLAYKIREIRPCKNIFFLASLRPEVDGKKQWLITLKKILDHVIFI